MTTPRGTWLGASRVLDRPVPIGEPYPHICGMRVIGYRSRRVVVVERKSCAACHELWQERRRQRTLEAEREQQTAYDPKRLPTTDPDARDIDARRTGDH